MKNELIAIVNFAYAVRNAMIEYFIRMIVLMPIISIIIHYVYKDKDERHLKMKLMFKIVLIVTLILVCILIGCLFVLLMIIIYTKLRFLYTTF